MDKRKKLQRMRNRLNETCKEYEIEINVKDTKMMIIYKTQKPKGMPWLVMLDELPLGTGDSFKYQGSWIKENARSDKSKSGIGLSSHLEK